MGTPRTRFLIRAAAVCPVVLVWLGASACTSLTGEDENPPQAAGPEQPNVLLVVVDDLNDWIEPLGHPRAKTPNFDRLAGRSAVFEHAYASSPLCNPSRVSLLTGVHPTTSGVYFNNQRHWTEWI